MKSQDNLYYKDTVRFWERNILNLGYGQYEGTGKYGIPKIKKQEIKNLELCKLIGFNEAVPYAKDRKECKYKGVHFFLHDYQFERIWKSPLRYVNMFKSLNLFYLPTFRLMQICL